MIFKIEFQIVLNTRYLTFRKHITFQVQFYYLTSHGNMAFYFRYLKFNDLVKFCKEFQVPDIQRYLVFHVGQVAEI